MQILGLCYMLLAACSVLELYPGVLWSALGLVLMDCASCLKFLTHGGEFKFKGGVFLLGCSLPTFSFFGLFFMFVYGLKVLKFTWCGKGGGLIQFLCDFRGRSCHSRNRVCSDDNCCSKFESCKSNSVKNPKPTRNCKDSSVVVVTKPDMSPDSDLDDDDGDYDDNEMRCYMEDGECDVFELRRLVKIERMRGDMANEELEKERMAAATAAEEAMAMILRIQREKSSMEIESKQYRRLAEQKEEYYQEVIQSLQWDVMQLESEMSALEENLKLNVTEEDEGEEELP